MHSQENKLHREREKCIVVCEARRGAHFAATSSCLQFKLCGAYSPQWLQLLNFNWWMRNSCENYHQELSPSNRLGVGRCWFGIIAINCWTGPSHGTHTHPFEWIISILSKVFRLHYSLQSFLRRKSIGDDLFVCSCNETSGKIAWKVTSSFEFVHEIIDRNSTSLSLPHSLYLALLSKPEWRIRVQMVLQRVSTKW